VKSKPVLIVMFAALFAFVLVMPVSALYFDYYYFETDKLTYEVGETINMVTSMIADYGQGGWCSISFSVVTDHGSVFNDGYPVSPSPDVRYFSSSYTILPEDTSPYSNPVTAYVILNVEIFDKYSQGVTDSIEVNITRGHLEVDSLSSLTVEANRNASLDFRVVSPFNSSISFNSNPVLVEIYNSLSSLVYSNVTTTDGAGLIHVDWAAVPLSPGNYSIEISGNGSDAFLPFLHTFSMEVVPESSELVRVDATSDDVFCKTPSGSFYDTVNITFQHLDESHRMINGSMISWVTIFASGTLTQFADGTYKGSIPVTASPGTYEVNVTAVHIGYQDATISFCLNALKRSITQVVNFKQLLSTHELLIEATLEDWQSSERLGSVQVNVSMHVGNWFSSSLGTTNSSGVVSVRIPIPPEYWGSGLLFLHADSTTYYLESNLSLPVDISLEPTFSFNLLTPPIRGESMVLEVTIQNPAGLPISGLPMDIYDSRGTTLASDFSNSTGVVCFEWLVSIDTDVGPITFIVGILANNQFVNLTSVIFQSQVTYPVWISSPNPEWVFVRGETTNVTILAQSEPSIDQNVTIHFQDQSGQLMKQTVCCLGQATALSWSISIDIALGTHTLFLQVLDGNYTILQYQEITVTVLMSISSEISNITAFYEKYLSFNLSTRNESGQELGIVDVGLCLDEHSSPFVSILNASPENMIQMLLPEWLSPGYHTLYLSISADMTIEELIQLGITIWVQTSISISVTTEFGGQDVVQKTSNTPIQGPEMISSISSGSMSLPPPILFNGTTSTEPSTARETSPIICPRLSSGTSNLSTVVENARTAVSGNGQSVRSLRDLKALLLSIIASSTDRDVLPNDITPHFALVAPDVIVSERKV
jgi:hypothetical protein